jgi:hypothetical protein
MRLWLPLALAGALLAACGASALAVVPSVAGPTGIVMLPTARIAPVNEWQTAAGYRSFRVEAMYGLEDIDVSMWSFNFLKGVSSDAEFWAMYTRASNGQDTDVWEFGGKYRFREGIMPTRGLWSGLDAAVGMSLGRWTDSLTMYQDVPFFTDTESLRAYFVLTKQLVPAYTGEWPWARPPHTRVDGTVGIYYLSVNPDFGDSASLLEWFLGMEVLFKNNIAFAVEYRFKDADLESDPVFSSLLRYPIDRQIDFEFGTTNASPGGLGLGEQDLFARITYRIPVADY